MVADERSASSLSSPDAATPRVADTETQTASFEVGSMRLELSSSPLATRLVIAGAAFRDVYVIEPSALAAWSRFTATLLTLPPPGAAETSAEFRAPYLIDREGRPSIAFEGLVGGGTVSYRLLVTRAEGEITGIMTTAEVVRGVAEAAAGAATIGERGR